MFMLFWRIYILPQKCFEQEQVQSKEEMSHVQAKMIESI